MTLEKDGSTWHIDHTMPCSSYDLLDENELRICFNLTKNRPMLTKKAISKGKKLITVFILYKKLKLIIFMKHYET